MHIPYYVMYSHLHQTGGGCERKMQKPNKKHFSLEFELD